MAIGKKTDTRTTDVRPRIVVSRCLGFDRCRWNGERIDDPFVRMLNGYAEFLPVCPECEIGLGVPRHPVRIVEPEAGAPHRLLQPATGEDHTARMETFCRRHGDEARDLDGFLLKHRSPSCGIAGVAVYRTTGKGSRVGSAAGFFAREMRARFPLLPMEDEGRMKNFTLREHFLARAYASARLRRARQAGTMQALVEFHARMKYLLMACRETGLRELGRLVANHDRLPAGEVYARYAVLLQETLARPAPYTGRINALQHAFGHLSEGLSASERQYFLDLLEDYRRGGLPMSVPTSLLKSWAIRFDESYLLKQYLLAPYPEELVEVTDSGKGRSL
jgi:uncharacterized protein YbgA (DUF1722 family)/uncharacterized protein YbbK (DUF523 family)